MPYYCHYCSQSAQFLLVLLPLKILYKLEPLTFMFLNIDHKMCFYTSKFLYNPQFFRNISQKNVYFSFTGHGVRLPGPLATLIIWGENQMCQGKDSNVRRQCYGSQANKLIIINIIRTQNQSNILGANQFLASN